MADTVWGVIIGRALQGAGAIASTIMALLTDLTREEHRMKAMATVGVSIGMSFSVALILGPWLVALGGLTLVFSATAVLALLGILVVIFIIPSPERQAQAEPITIWPEIVRQAKNHQLWPLNTGIFYCTR